MAQPLEIGNLLPSVLADPTLRAMIRRGRAGVIGATLEAEGAVFMGRLPWPLLPEVQKSIDWWFNALQNPL
jgi:hypothetical protein